MYGHEQAKFVESPITRIFGGKSRLTVRAPNRPDAVTVEDWQSLQLNIQVSFPSFLPLPSWPTSQLLSQPDSVLSIQDSLVHISQPQPVQVGQPNLIGASQQVQVEVLPPVLVLHLKRFVRDVTANGIFMVKISKAVQLAPELEIPPGAIFSSASFMLAKAKDPSRLC
jgi:ubiquitin carboxyl-terminal hydrolase 10